jgi:hypothetical protein
VNAHRCIEGGAPAQWAVVDDTNTVAGHMRPNGTGERTVTMTSAEHRRAPRYAADWAARYRLDERDEWRACRVVNVSLDGAALELVGVTFVEALTGPIIVQIASISGDEIGVTVRAVIRRHEQLESGQVLVGVEFSVLRDEERRLLRLLVGLRNL